MSQYFPKLYRIFGENVRVELYLFIYTTKIKKATMFDASNFAANSDLASLKAGQDKIDVDKL